MPAKFRKYHIVGNRYFIGGLRCFWHGHSVDGHLPHSNTDFWRNKIEKNQLRDEQNKKKLLVMGWAVITIWECQLKPAVRKQTLSELEYYIHRHDLDRHGLRRSYYLGDDENVSLVAEEQTAYKRNPSSDEPKKGDVEDKENPTSGSD